MRSMTFLVNDRSTGGAIPAVAVTITENSDGSLSFSLNVIGPYTGDLRGFFFDLANENRIGTLTVTPTSAGFTEFRQGNDSVKDLGNGANMQGLLGSDGGYDAGIEIGTAGIGKDDYQSFSFTLTSSAGPLTLEDFSNVDFGLRLTSVGSAFDGCGDDRDGSVKLLEHTSSAIDARNDSNSATEDSAPNPVGGNVFSNDLNLTLAHFVTAVNGSAANVGEDIEGTYGTLHLNLNGTYTYTLDNSRTAVQTLADGQTVTETFSYTAKNFDEFTSFSTDSAVLSITITGTNDGPEIVAGDTGGAVFEDGSRRASGGLIAVDIDQNSELTWSVTGSGPMTPRADYRFLLDNLNIVQNGALFFNDDFGSGGPPPAGTTFGYFTGGTFLESGGRAIMDGSLGVIGVVPPPGGVGVFHSAILNTDIGPDVTQGLKRGQNFKVEARYDLVIPAEAPQSYAVRLTDGADDIVEVGVRSLEDGSVAVVLRETNVAGAFPTTLAAITLEPAPGDNQIVLRLEHAADTDVVTGSFDLLNGGVVTQSRAFGVAADIFGNEGWTRAQITGFSGAQPQNGVYGTLSVEADGDWSYQLNNAAANVQALAQGQHATDTFTVRVTDEHGASDTQTVTVDVIGTNDAPVITGGSNFGTVFEDAMQPFQQMTASGQLSAFDPDQGAVLRWSAGPATIVPVGSGFQFLGYSSDFHFTLDQFTVTRNGATIFDDPFSDGIAPPSAPNFSNGIPASYLGTFGYAEADGRLHLDGARALALRGVGNPSLSAGQLPVLLTNNDPNDLTRGLKNDDSFTVEGRFDLVVPGAGQAYGIALTDSAFGGVPVDQLGDDLLTLIVRRDELGGLLVRLDQLDVVADTVTTLGTVAFTPAAGESQIVLRLIHDVAHVGVVRAGFDLLGGAGGPRTLSFTQTGRIFGTDTPGTGDDENWTRAQILAFGPDTGGTTHEGAYGSLSVQQNGTWTYTLNNGAANVQALAQGQFAQDVVSVRVIDEHGLSSFRPVFITVAGTNDAVVITGGDTTGEVREDTILSASGLITFTDVDSLDLHTAFFAPFASNTTSLGTFSLAPVVEGPNAADGSVAWTYTLDNTAAGFLDEGDTATEIYTVFIRDDLGELDTETVSVTIRGTEDGNGPPLAVADTNGLDAVIEAGFAPGAPAGDPFAAGNVLANDSDPDPNPGLHVSALNGAPILDIGFATGTYGALQINADGSWSYTLHDFDQDTNALAQGEAAFDQFTYTVSDQQGASADTTLSIAISGTNDFPTLEPVSNTGDVTEDGQSVTGGQLVGSDPDHGAILTFGLPFQPTNSHAADYLFAIDHFTVTRFRPGTEDTAPVQILNDDFGDGAPPPSGVFANGNPAYFSTGAFTEAGDRALMDGGVAQGTFPFGGPITVGHTTVATTNNSADVTQGLRISHDFDVMGRFDAELPQRAGQAYGIALTDQRTGFGGDDHIQLLVRHDADGVVRVVLREGDAAANSVTPIDSIDLDAFEDGDQIVLHLTHDPAQGGTIVGSFELFRDTQIVQSHTFAGTGQIFGTETPGASDDEPFTRAMFLATSPAQTFSRTGTFGTLVLDESGAWQYFLNNADPDTQALGQGQSAIDSFDALVIDQFRTGGIGPIQVTVHGTSDVVNNPPDITGGTTTGVVYEDSTASVARGQLTAVDMDPGTVLNWSVGETADFGGVFVDGTGRWTYSLNNFALQHLAQGGATLTDTFTVRAADSFGAFDSETVTITINGTNDRPVLPVNPISIVALEDGGPVGAQAQGSDVDEGALLRWSLTRDGTLGYFSDYEFRADSFSIEKNFAPLFRDEFNAGNPPPSAPDFIPSPPPGGSALTSYSTSGGFQEDHAGDGTLIMNGTSAAAFRGPGFDGLSVGSEAILVTNVDPLNTQAGLKKNHQFVVDGVFDFVEPALARQAYGITLTDAVNQVSDDQLSLVVRRDAFDDQVYVQFNNAGGILDTSQVVARTVLPLGTEADQIRLRFSHDADSGDIVASYRLLFEGADTGIGGTLGQAGIFGTDTPLFAGDDENWTRAGLFATGVDLNEGIFPGGGVQTLVGDYGTLTVSGSGELTYSVDNADLDVQALGQGQSLADSFFVRVTDQFGLSASQRVDVTVNGVDEIANRPPDAAADNNDFDSVIEAGVNFMGIAISGDPTASGNVLANDTDPDAGDALGVVAVNGVQVQAGVPLTLTLTYGSLLINSDGSWTYTLDNSDPDTNALRQLQPGFVDRGFENVSYTVADEHGATDTGLLSIGVSGTNDAPVAVADSNSVTEDLVLTATGNVLTNDRDPEGDNLQIAAPPGAIPGTYGTLTLNPDGSYVYQVNPALVNFLAADEVAHDIFERDYSVGDGFAFINSTLLDIAIIGADEAPSFADGAVFEDGARKTSGQVDLSSAESWSVTGTGPMTPWAEYRFRIDNLNIQRSGTQFFNDDFGGGGPPPVAPAFGYLTGGTFTETGGRTTMDGSFAVATAPGFAGHSAILNTDTTADPNSGLKRNHDFRVEARFDLVIPDQKLQTYGIRLTDSGVPGGGDDVVEIAVRRMEDGSVAAILRESNVAGSVPIILAAIPLGNLPSDNRIVLRLEHTAGSEEVRASFDLVDGAIARRTDFGTVGLIFGNEDWTRAQFVGFSPSQPQNGVYGTLSVEADGEWTYSLNNGIGNVQALAQGERVTDVFTLQGGGDVQTIAVDVFGTNDTPFGSPAFSSAPAPGTTGAYVIEDGAQQTARGSAFGFDVDHGQPVQWSVTANAVPGLITAYSAEYLFKVDELRITRDGADFMLDTFDDGVPPPVSSPDFSYIVNGGFSESAGRAILDGHRGVAIGGVGTSELLVANVAVLDTNLGAASPGRGLKSHHDFIVEARFDLDPMFLPTMGQAFALSLSDRSLGELPFEQLGDDIVGLLVTRDAAGNLAVVFEERDAVTDSINVLHTEELLDPVTGSQIVLRLEHDTADFGRVSASFDVISGGEVSHHQFAEDSLRRDRIFGAETPDDPYDDEVWTRAQIWAFGPDTVGGTTVQGTYGSLSVEPDGDWTYTLNNNAGNVQSLNSGQIAIDSFNLRAMDAYGASSSRQFNVNVIGTDDGPAVPLTLFGGSTAETLVGSMLDDHFTGGGGSDLLIGLAGRDTFYFNNVNEGVDTIADFTPGAGGDVLDIHDVLDYVAPVPPPGMPPVVPFNFVQLGQFQAVDGPSTVLMVNADGAGTDFVQLATLQGVGGLLLEDLIANGNLVLA